MRTELGPATGTEPAGPPPPLEPGDRLDREEFERRYRGMPHLKRAELLRGVVHMPSPASLEQHAEPQAILVGWFFNYWANTPRLRLGDNATLRLGPEDDPQPDVLLMIPAALGGRARVDPGGYVSGPPELVAEVSASTVSYDLHVKLDLYRERGVREYLVWRVRDREVDWFVLRDSAYERLAAGTDGVLRSEVFPGLWLDPGALVTADPARLLAVLQKGLATPEHAAFRKALLAHA